MGFIRDSDTVVDIETGDEIHQAYELSYVPKDTMLLCPLLSI